MRYFVIGDIVNTQGIKGEMRVIPQTDDPTRFELLDFVYIERRGKTEKFNIESIRYHKQFVLLKLEGVDDMTAAERFKGGVIKITEDLALPLAEGQYYLRDLYDLDVFTIEGEHLGILTDILATGANDVYVVTPNKGKDILIPAIKQCIINVDLESKRMTVKLLEGLRD